MNCWSLFEWTWRRCFCHEPLCAEERLAITLRYTALIVTWIILSHTVSPHRVLSVVRRYLASGSALKQVALSFRVSPSTCRRVVHETCRVLWQYLQPLYLPVSIAGLIFLYVIFVKQIKGVTCIEGRPRKVTSVSLTPCHEKKFVKSALPYFWFNVGSRTCLMEKCCWQVQQTLEFS